MTFLSAQDKTKPEVHYHVHRCAPKLISREGGKSPEFQFRNGERYKQSPVVAYEILESGEIAISLVMPEKGEGKAQAYDNC